MNENVKLYVCVKSYITNILIDHYHILNFLISFI